MTSEASSSAAPGDRAPQLFIVLALPDHRGQAERAVRSWTQDQTCAAGLFEVIVVADGAEPALEARIRTYLRPGDRLLRSSGHVLSLTNVGARAAKGEWLFITESHCLAAPDCVHELLSYCRSTDLDGACCNSVGLNETLFAEMEQQVFEEAFGDRSHAAAWNKMVIRGSVLRREVFLAVGGFPSQFGHFGEVVLGATLHSLSYRLGFAEKAFVAHYNTCRRRELVPNLVDYGRGEIRHRLATANDVESSYVPACPAWQRRELYHRENARWLGSLLCCDGASTSTVDVRGKFWWKCLPLMLWGARWPLWKSSLRLLSTRLMLAAGRVHKKTYSRAYKRYWAAVIRHARLQEIAAALASTPAHVASEVTAADGEISLDTGRLRLVRTTAGDPSELDPVCWLSATAPVADCEVTLEIELPYDGVAWELDAFFERSPVAMNRCPTTTGVLISFAVTREMFAPGSRTQRIALFSSAVEGRRPRLVSARLDCKRPAPQMTQLQRAA